MTELLDFALSIAREAGEGSRRAAGAGACRSQRSKSTVVDVVTEADREVERLIRGRRRRAARRRDPRRGGQQPRGTTGGLTWVVDPIDGFTNYLYGIPHYAVSIAVVKASPTADLARLAGVVHNPATGETFWAETGAGARVSAGDPAAGEPIRVADPVPLESALIGTGFAYDARMRGIQGGIVAALLPKGARHQEAGHRIPGSVLRGVRPAGRVFRAR
ncbi:MAG: inositol monophosphatase family protein [Schumannella sp.]